MSKTSQKLDNEDQTPVEKMVQGLLYQSGGITPLFAICDVLQIPAFVVAEDIGLTRSQVSHYRKGFTEIPLNRMESIVKLLKRLIAETEKEIIKEKKKSPDRKTQLLIADLERRVDLAKKISDL